MNSKEGIIYQFYEFVDSLIRLKMFTVQEWLEKLLDIRNQGTGSNEGSF